MSTTHPRSSWRLSGALLSHGPPVISGAAWPGRNACARTGMSPAIAKASAAIRIACARRRVIMGTVWAIALPKSSQPCQICVQSIEDLPGPATRSRGVERESLSLGPSGRHGRRSAVLGVKGLQLPRPIVAIFDADFVPPLDFLRRTLPHLADDRVVVVQARWGHLNRDFSP